MNRLCETCGGPINRGGVASARNRRCLACRTAAVMATFTPPAEPSVWSCARCGSTGTGKQQRRHNRTALCQGCVSLLRAAGQWRCARCEQIKPVAAFRVDGPRLRHLCRACEAARSREFYRENAEAERARRVANYWKNPEAERAAERARYRRRPNIAQYNRERKVRRKLKFFWGAPRVR